VHELILRLGKETALDGEQENEFAPAFCFSLQDRRAKACYMQHITEFNLELDAAARQNDLSHLVFASRESSLQELSIAVRLDRNAGKIMTGLPQIRFLLQAKPSVIRSMA
jgi:hypothetical protein